VDNGTVYAVSLCDVTQKHMEYLLVRDTLFARHRTEDLGFYVSISIALIVVVTCAAQNISHLLGGEREPVNVLLALAACIVLVVVSFVHNIWMHSFVTWEDMVVFWACVAYVVFYLLMWAIKLGEGTVAKHVQEYPVNVLIGSILLGILRLYDGIECVYVLPVLFVLCVRVWYKTLSLLAASGPVPEATSKSPPAPRDSEFRVAQALQGGEGLALGFLFVMHRSSLVFDFVLFALTHQFGFRTLFYEPHHGDAYATLLLLLSLSLAGVAWRRNVKDRGTY
jgi:hypothetical protein